MEINTFQLENKKKKKDLGRIRGVPPSGRSITWPLSRACGIDIVKQK
jgi:hypothetical protein